MRSCTNVKGDGLMMASTYKILLIKDPSPNLLWTMLSFVHLMNFIRSSQVVRTSPCWIMNQCEVVASCEGIQLSFSFHPSLTPRLAIIELFHIVCQQALVISLAYAKQVLVIAQHLVVRGEYFIEMRLIIQLGENHQ